MKWDGYKNELIMIFFLKFGYIVIFMNLNIFLFQRKKIIEGKGGRI